jgi:hypothetical protein
MATPSYIQLLDLMQEYVESKSPTEGWVCVRFEKTEATFYYTKPLTKMEKWLKKSPNPTIIVESEINDNGRVTERHVHS